MLNSHHPEIYFTKGTTVQTMLKQKIGQQQTKLYFLSDFNRPALELDLPVVLTGPSNIGKTQYAMAHFENPLVVKQRDDLKNISPSIDGIIFDDMDFTEWSEEHIISLLDIDLTRSLPARNMPGEIQKDGTARPRGLGHAHRGRDHAGMWAPIAEGRVRPQAHQHN